MTRFDPKVRKVGQRLGTLQASPMADVPNLPNLPYLSLMCASMRPRIYARVYVTRFTLGRLGRLGRLACLLACRVPNLGFRLGRLGSCLNLQGDLR
jgi:hypothetical protein